MTIQDKLTACREELERQEAIEKAAYPRLWWEHPDGIVSGPRAPQANESRYGYEAAVKGQAVVVTDDGFYPPYSLTKLLICLARNLNPVRLAEARKNYEAAEAHWQEIQEPIPFLTTMDRWNGYGEHRAQLETAYRLLGLEME